MIKIYKYDIDTKEFIQELEINEAYGTNLPFTTTVKPLTKKEGFAVCFNGTKWEFVEDNRDKTVYVKATKKELKVDYLGKIKDEHTLLVPKQFDEWDYSLKRWIEDTIEKDKYEIQAKISEYKIFLSNTDHKFYNRYKPKEGEDLDALEVERDEKREFIRLNEGA